jgi:phosphatidylglycerophosphatase A
MIKTFNSFFVTMFGLGKIKFIPGTFGSLATTIILFYLFHKLNISSNIILIGWIIIFIYSFYAVSTHTKDSKNKDPREIIIDEFLGHLYRFIFMKYPTEQQRKVMKQLFIILCFLYYLDILIL